jgi:predicted ABC-type exoprotein transport system permease subunit
MTSIDALLTFLFLLVVGAIGLLSWLVVGLTVEQSLAIAAVVAITVIVFLAIIVYTALKKADSLFLDQEDDEYDPHHFGLHKLEGK